MPGVKPSTLGDLPKITNAHPLLSSEEAESIMDMIAQELPYDHNPIHGIMSVFRLSLQDSAMGCSTTLDVAKGVPCNATVLHGGDTMKEHRKHP